MDVLSSHKHIAIGLSGGGDSTALTHFLAHHLTNTQIHALIVDHDLRPNSAQEAETVKDRASQWPNVTAHILTWVGDKPDHSLMEAARDNRYALMQSYCETHDIPLLLTAHHADDQQETLLMRLSSGSGLDGLCAMAPYTELSPHVTVMRPCLHLLHDDLIAYCRQEGLSWVEDPTNNNPLYERSRFRQTSDALAQEGLTAKRVTKTTHRLQRAQAALNDRRDQCFKQALLTQKETTLLFRWDALQSEPEEIILRVLMHAVRLLQPQTPYIKLEKIESLCVDLKAQTDFRKRSLHHCLFSLEKGLLKIEKEA